MSQNGKGSKPRPLSVSYNKYADNFDDIFRKKENKIKIHYSQSKLDSKNKDKQK